MFDLFNSEVIGIGYTFTSFGKYDLVMSDRRYRDIGLLYLEDLYSYSCRLTIRGLDIHEYL